MHKHKRILTIVAIITGLLPWPLVLAADEPGPWLCTPIEQIECGSSGKCQNNMFENLHLPQFIKIDLVAKRASGTEEGQEEAADIQQVTRLDGRLILQGVQNERGWSMVIVEETGDMTLSVSGDDAAWLAFGDCTPLARWTADGAPASASTTDTPAK